MATRSNALSELTRFWLQDCKGFLTRESIPVKFVHNRSDIDFIVSSPDSKYRKLTENISFKYAIIETKDERDFDKTGNNFADRLYNDYYDSMNKDYLVDEDTKCNFSMLKIQHHKIAQNIFGTSEFSKIFIFHNIKKEKFVENELEDLVAHNIHILTVDDILNDIVKYVKEKPDGAGIRNSLVGDILDLLINYRHWGPS